MTSEPLLLDGFITRPAAEKDLPRLADFEIEIARISFPGDPVTDPQVHIKKLAKAMQKDPEGMFVLDRGGEIAGWLWITINANFMTGERYATFRSFAVAADLRGTPIPEAFFRFGLDYCCQKEVVRATGKVHVQNMAMRSLYKAVGFEAKHLTMEIDICR